MAWFWKSKKEEAREKPKNPLEKHVTDEARAFIPLKTDGFCSARWHKADVDENDQHDIYWEAHFLAEDKWEVREVLTDHEGGQSYTVKNESCFFFEALYYLGLFEGQQNTPLAGGQYKKTKNGLPEKYYKDVAHENRLFISQDGLPYMNRGGVPVNADNVTFSEEELTSVRKLTVKPQQVPIENSSLQIFDTANPGYISRGTSLTDHFGSIETQAALIKIEKKLAAIVATLEDAGTSWAGESWNQTNSYHMRTIKELKFACDGFEELIRMLGDSHRAHILNLQLEMQILYTRWLLETSKHSAQKYQIDEHPEVIKVMGYSTLSRNNWASYELDYLTLMIQEHKDSAAQDSQAIHINYDLILPMLMKPETSSDFVSRLSEFKDRIKDVSQNFSKNMKEMSEKVTQRSLQEGVQSGVQSLPCLGLEERAP